MCGLEDGSEDPPFAVVASVGTVGHDVGIGFQVDLHDPEVKPQQIADGLRGLAVAGMSEDGRGEIGGHVLRVLPRSPKQQCGIGAA